MNEISSHKILITPKMAREWIQKCNTHNRKVSNSIVERYARDMKHGAWMLSNQGIGFDEKGVLIDGQHRLFACIMANTSFLSFVIHGLHPKAQMVIDVQKKRTVGDQLSLFSEIENASLKAAIANCIVANFKNTRTVSLSVSSAKEIIDLYSDEIEAVLSNRGGSLPGLLFTPTIASIVIAAKVNMEKAVEFKNKYFKGNDLAIGDPALTLRNYMLSRTVHGQGGATYRRMIVCYAMTALWYSFIGKSLKQLKSSTQGLDYFINKQKTYVSLITECLDI